jgi:hypothetical protein
MFACRTFSQASCEAWPDFTQQDLQHFERKIRVKSRAAGIAQVGEFKFVAVSGPVCLKSMGKGGSCNRAHLDVYTTNLNDFCLDRVRNNLWKLQSMRNSVFAEAANRIQHREDIPAW